MQGLNAREVHDFTQALHRRLEAGQRAYGDTSFNRPTDELLGELAEEALDLAGWGFVLWARVQRLKARQPVQGQGPKPCPCVACEAARRSRTTAGAPEVAERRGAKP